jgi:hypothetical protein
VNPLNPYLLLPDSDCFTLAVQAVLMSPSTVSSALAGRSAVAASPQLSPAPSGRGRGGALSHRGLRCAACRCFSGLVDSWACPIRPGIKIRMGLCENFRYPRGNPIRILIHAALRAATALSMGRCCSSYL